MHLRSKIFHGMEPAEHSGDGRLLCSEHTPKRFVSNQSQAKRDEWLEIGAIQGGQGFLREDGGGGNQAVGQGAAAPAGGVEKRSSEGGDGGIHRLDAMEDGGAIFLFGGSQRTAQILGPRDGRHPERLALHNPPLDLPGRSRALLTEGDEIVGVEKHPGFAPASTARIFGGFFPLFEIHPTGAETTSQPLQGTQAPGHIRRERGQRLAREDRRRGRNPAAGHGFFQHMNGLAVERTPVRDGTLFEPGVEFRRNVFDQKRRHGFVMVS